MIFDAFKKYIGCFFILIFLFSFAEAQVKDSLSDSQWKELKKTEFKRSLRLTVSLVAVGLIAKTNNNFFSNAIFEDARNRQFPDFESNLDDYLALAPVGAVFLLDAVNHKARHSIGNQALLVLKSGIIATAIVFPMKEISKQERPDGSSDQSFPSAHTAQAFIAATFLHKEFGHRNPTYTFIGYSAAATVGIYRVLNNKHFVSDILVGAGIGVLSTNLAYLTHENRWGKKRTYHLSALPTYTENGLGFQMALRF